MKTNHLNIKKTGTMGPRALTAINTAALELALSVLKAGLVQGDMMG